MRPSFLTALILTCIGISPVENCAFSQSSQAFVQKHVQRESFSMLIPEEFEDLQISQPYVEIALRHKEMGYPSFNILLLPHAVQEPEEPSAFAMRTLQNYRDIGLTSAIIDEFGYWDLGTHKAYFAKLSYQYIGLEQLQSIVIGIRLQQKELLATFIAKGSNMKRDLPLLETILNSLKILEQPVNPVKEKTGLNAGLRRTMPAYITLFLIILVSSGVYLWRKKYFNKRRNAD